MSWLKRVIARLLTIRTQPLVVLVQPMPTAGLAPQELTTQAGNKRSAQATKRPRQSKSSPAQQALPKKPKVAKSTTAVSKGTNKKPKPVQTAKSRKQAGNSTPTRASKTRHHAK